MAHCPSYKRPTRMTPSLRSRGGENSSMIMILLQPDDFVCRPSALFQLQTDQVHWAQRGPARCCLGSSFKDQSAEEDPVSTALCWKHKPVLELVFLTASSSSSLSSSLFPLHVTPPPSILHPCSPLRLLFPPRSRLVSRRFAAIQACEQQLHQFRSLSGSLLRWLQTAQDQLPSKEASLTTEALQRRVQQLKVCAALVVQKQPCVLRFRPLCQ